ncbi:G-type lectin S-receptor-like serine/threonine-protein kinase RKS1 isoform X2 [Manihot esculenta]|uniref:G-type lectin S-receptor-like serine/threonine-protein kinase RKS1 isoform X2 n=1 Tax=Manihot esculenta TaxID=3983 RepID=UPI001CC7BE2D|nr:G-type lectin S-receptor-like serine/threonine-protein kinase RKS1 isoform X2 [Manihot esculenta]
MKREDYRATMDFQKLFLQFLLLIFHFTFSSSKDTLAINQTIQDGHGHILISRENNFALGFFSPGSSRYRYLGIWYHKVREKTVIWVANRNHPINGSSGVLSINQYGNLILYSNHNQTVPVWSTNVSVEVADTSVAQLLDSGNLILVEDRNKIVWQSFDYPTDTLLPGMKVGMNQKTSHHFSLESWKSADDPRIGDYKLKLNPAGSPQLFLYSDIKYYWRSIPWPLKSYAGVWNYSFINNEDEIYMNYVIADASVILRIVLDSAGFLKHLVWHESAGKWKECLSEPINRCDVYGHCGAYGKCNSEHINRDFECACLPGYEPKSPRDWHILRDGSSGCVRKRLDSSPVCGLGEGFIKVPYVKIPDTSAAAWVALNMAPTDCEQECRRNCSCSAYANIDIAGKGTGCLAWYGELMDTVDNEDAGYDIYVRVDALELAEIARQSNGYLETKGMLAILVVSVVSAWFIIILFAYMWLKKKKKRSMRNKWSERLRDTIDDAYHKVNLAANEVGGSINHPDIAFFDFNIIIDATNNFSSANKLGQGGFGLVYKEIAVKRLSKNSSQGIEEFKNEVILIAKLQHKNLVKLLGCCIQAEELMLIYEYLPNKSLDSLLFDESRSILDWGRRFNIIIGIARGILYIHQDSRLQIIHRDLKTSNILLDAEMNPKISDFGLARIFERDQIQEKTKRIVGTLGYMSPEYVVFGKFSTKSDVFSFGVILFEIITGKKSNGFCQEGWNLSLIGYIWQLWREERPLEIIDSSLKESYPTHEILRCIQIGLLCVQEDAMDRPTMSAVLLMLNSEITLPSPKQPAFVFIKSSNNSCKAVAEQFGSVNELTISEVVSR